MVPRYTPYIYYEDGAFYAHCYYCRLRWRVVAYGWNDFVPVNVRPI